MTYPIVVTADIAIPEKHVRNTLKAVSAPYLAEFLEVAAHASLIERLKNRFASEGDDATGPWLPLSDATMNFRQSGGFPEAHPINVRTGSFRDWLLGDRPDVRLLGPGAAGYTFPGGTLGNGQDIEEKFQTAQVGRGNPKTPPRPVLGLSNTDTVELTAALGTFINSVQLGIHP